MTDMSQTVTPGSAAPAAAPRSLPARILGVIFSPRATYAAIAARPHWLGVLALIVVVGGTGTFVFMSTEIGKEAWIDAGVRQSESFSGRPMSDAQYDRMEQLAKYAPYIGVAGQAVSLPLMAVVISAIALAVFTAALGGDASFKQVLAIVSHSGVVVLLSQLFGLPIAYARETMSSAANLAVFTPFLDETTFAARVLGSIDLFIVWWVVSLSIGLGVLYKKRTGPIATTLLILYVAIGVVIAAIKSAVSGA
jgi:hypothetical protein